MDKNRRALTPNPVCFGIFKGFLRLFFGGGDCTVFPWRKREGGLQAPAWGCNIIVTGLPSWKTCNAINAWIQDFLSIVLPVCILKSEAGRVSPPPYTCVYRKTRSEVKRGGGAAQLLWSCFCDNIRVTHWGEVGLYLRTQSHYNSKSFQFCLLPISVQFISLFPY